jgi:hypothetical protein
MTMPQYLKATACPVEHRWRRRFLETMSVSGQTTVYINPVTRKMMTRQPTQRHPKRLPSDAVRVGHYVQPCPVSFFIADMRAAMAALPTIGARA